MVEVEFIAKNLRARPPERQAPSTARTGRLRQDEIEGDLTLAGFEAWIGLVDHIDPALAPNDLVVTVPATQRFQ